MVEARNGSGAFALRTDERTEFLAEEVIEERGVNEICDEERNGVESLRKSPKAKALPAGPSLLYIGGSRCLL